MVRRSAHNFRSPMDEFTSLLFLNAACQRLTTTDGTFGLKPFYRREPSYFSSFSAILTTHIMLWIWTLTLAIGIITIYAAHLFYTRVKRTASKNLFGKHVVITGGSSGIGKAAACEAARLGAHVTIIGRDLNKLKSATKEIGALCPDQPKQIIQYAALDVTSDYEIVRECFTNLEIKVGPIFMLVNCAGACICGLFEEMKVEDIKGMVNLNYFGTALPTRAVLSKMRGRNEGIVVFVSSEAALIGIYGYSAYSAGKWAVRGLAEAIGMELVGTNVRVMLSYPPDTDTPGLQQENTTKPEETKIISASGGLHTPDSVGTKLIHDALIGKTYSTYSISGSLMNILYGVSVESASQLFTQIFFMGFLRIVMVGIMASFHKIIRDQLKLKKSQSGGTHFTQGTQSAQVST